MQAPKNKPAIFLNGLRSIFDREKVAFEFSALEFQIIEKYFNTNRSTLDCYEAILDHRNIQHRMAARNKR